MALALLGYVVFMLAATAVGVRLLLAGLRHGGRPELALGLGFLCSGGLGFLLMLVPLLAPGLDPGAREAAAIAGQGISNAGFLGLYFFNTTVFANGRRAAWLASLVGCALLAVAVVGGGAAGAASFQDVESPWYWCNFLGRSGAFLWCAVAGLRHHALSRRRAALGLGDAVVANRFLLWGLFGLCATSLNVLGTLGAWVAEAPGQPPLAIALGVSVLGVGAAACMWLAFFPPRGYLRRLRGAAAA